MGGGGDEEYMPVDQIVGKFGQNQNPEGVTEEKESIPEMPPLPKWEKGQEEEK